jgi:hypothetical protein
VDNKHLTQNIHKINNMAGQIFEMMEMLCCAIRRTVAGGSAVFELVLTEVVVSIDKNVDYCLQSLDRAIEAAAATLQTRNKTA